MRATPPFSYQCAASAGRVVALENAAAINPATPPPRAPWRQRLGREIVSVVPASGQFRSKEAHAKKATSTGGPNIIPMAAPIAIACGKGLPTRRPLRESIHQIPAPKLAAHSPPNGKPPNRQKKSVAGKTIQTLGRDFDNSLTATIASVPANGTQNKCAIAIRNGKRVRYHPPLNRANGIARNTQVSYDNTDIPAPLARCLRASSGVVLIRHATNSTPRPFPLRPPAMTRPCLSLRERRKEPESAHEPLRDTQVSLREKRSR